MANLVGQYIDRYHIIEQLGLGGMAVVYKAYDTRLEREVAVKVIRREAVPAKDWANLLKRFEREARTLARLYHPNIVRIHDYGEHQGAPYLVMDYVPGGTLKDLLGRPLPYPQAARLLVPVAQALAFAHQQGIVHRDIKPANILINRNGEPILSDFGIAKIIESEEGSTQLTSTGIGIGTPEYMAPEQWEGKSCPQTDIYALGVVLYELITGRKPYTAETPAAIYRMILVEPLTRPKVYIPTLPDIVEQVLFKALAKNPADRFENMGLMAAALEKLTADTPSPAVDDVTLTRLQPSQAGTAAEGKGKSLLPLIVGVGIGGIALMIIAGLIAAGILLSRAKETPTTLSPTTPEIAQIQPALEEKSPLPAQNDLPLSLTSPSSTTAAPPNTETPASLPSATDTPTNAPSETPSPTVEPSPTHTETPRLGSIKISPKDGMIMIYIPEGEFPMGTDSCSRVECRDAVPQHDVYLDAYWIDQTEVTNAMFARFVNETGYVTDAEEQDFSRVLNLDHQRYEHLQGADWRHPLGPSSSLNGLEQHPVVHVSWYDAVAYCEWAGKRLPTEAEWEKAARGVEGRLFPWGNNEPDGSMANYADKNMPTIWADVNIDDGYRFTSPVGNYPNGATSTGLLDMAGNVWEWVADWYSEDYYSNSDYKNPKGPMGSDEKGLRGGSAFSKLIYLYAYNRFKAPPDYADQLDGFRCVMDP